MNKQETIEEVSVVKRTELYNSILSIVKQIPRKEVEDDVMDAPSCAYELQQLFLKWQAEKMYSEDEVRDLLIDMSNYIDTKELKDNSNTNFSEWIRKRNWFLDYLFKQKHK